MNAERGEGARARLGERSLFPSLEALAYLNHAAISPPSTPVQDAVNAVIDFYASRGGAAFARWLEQRRALRAQRGRLTYADPGDIAFVSSTPRWVVDVAVCFPWKPGAINVQGAVTMPDGRLRFAPHWPHDVAEVPRVLDALDRAMEVP